MPARTLAIGDIHGCLAHLDALLQSVAPTQDDHVILLGDYVDRGPDSANVLNRILALSRTHRLSAIKGNHEQMMLDARESHDHHFDWIVNGGDKTLCSYGGYRGTLRDVPSAHWHSPTGTSSNRNSSITWKPKRTCSSTRARTPICPCAINPITC